MIIAYFSEKVKKKVIVEGAYRYKITTAQTENKKNEFFLIKLLTTGNKCVIIADVNGASPSGKATDSDSVIT